MKRKLDLSKIGFAIAFVTTTILFIHKAVQAGTLLFFIVNY